MGAISGAQVTERAIDDAQHEAAHVVVGVALGLHLRKAAVGGATNELGYAIFEVPKAARMAWAITLAAGVAFERRAGDLETARADVKELRRAGFDKHSIATLAVAADAILETRGLAHARVTRALLQRDLTGADIEALARGERLDADS
jgi:hypothetical protein